jgi:peptidoglycan/LPS O-acetylase OafA/YrhL
VGVAASLLCAVLSWRFVEAPALRYARRFRPGTAIDPYPVEAVRQERVAA